MEEGVMGEGEKERTNEKGRQRVSRVPLRWHSLNRQSSSGTRSVLRSRRDGNATRHEVGSILQDDDFVMEPGRTPATLSSEDCRVSGMFCDVRSRERGSAATTPIQCL
jgi:hypothetical protein